MGADPDEPTYGAAIRRIPRPRFAAWGI